MIVSEVFWVKELSCCVLALPSSFNSCTQLVGSLKKENVAGVVSVAHDDLVGSLVTVMAKN